MHPELLVFSMFENDIIIMSYSFFYGVAVAFVVIASYFNALKFGFGHKQIICMLLFTIIGGFVGARVLHFVFNPDMYLEGNLGLFDLRMRGFTIVGGLIFAVIGGLIGGKVCKVNIWKFGDVTIPFVAFGVGIARLGCFLNGCCFGHVTHVPWGVKFPLMSFAHQYQITHELGNIFVALKVHPTQIYEMLYAIIGGIIIILINKKKIFDGAGILFFGMWFSLFRTINMFFRQMPDSLVLSQIQYSIIYGIIFLGCLGLFLYKCKSENKNYLEWLYYFFRK